MDIIDILVMQRKQELEMVTYDMKMYEERYKDTKDNYINALKLRELRDSSPENHEKVINYISEQEKDFESMMLDITLAPEEYTKKLLKKKKED